MRGCSVEVEDDRGSKGTIRGMLTRVLLTLIFLLQASQLIAQTPSPAGVWTVRLGERTLLVLTLTGSVQKGLAFSGSLAGPKHWTSADGMTFREVQGGTGTKPIIASEWRGDSLLFTVQTPDKPTDKDAFLLHLTDPGHAELHPEEDLAFTIEMARAEQPAAVSTDWDPTKSYSPDDGLPSNPEMKRIFDEDQAVRQPGSKIDWSKVGPTDADRRTATMKLLNEGALHTGDDFIWAAFIFQHGATPDDYLLAHTLAMVAVAKGNSGALWIGTATLDRYLQSIGQKQIYGTQFKTPKDAPTTQEPYNRTLVSDALRRQLGVPALAAQSEQRKEYDKQRTAAK